jgi:hypothetical protein
VKALKNYQYVICFFFLLIGSRFSNVVHGQGTIPETVPPIIVIGQPPANFCTGTVPWVLTGEFQLPKNDPCGSGVFDVDIENVKHVGLNYNQLVDLTKNGAAKASIWLVKIAYPLYLPLISSN